MSITTFLFGKRPKPEPETPRPKRKISVVVEEIKDREGAHYVEEYGVFWSVNRKYTEHNWMVGERDASEVVEKFKWNERPWAEQHCAFLNKAVEREIERQIDWMKGRPELFIDDTNT